MSKYEELADRALYEMTTGGIERDLHAITLAILALAEAIKEEQS